MRGAHRLRVVLVVWKPRIADDPSDVTTAGWPHVLQVQLARDREVWEPPGVVVRPGERVVTAAARVADAVGIGLPNLQRVLAVDERPAVGGAPAELMLLVDGGWCTDADVVEVPDCLCAHERGCRHRRRWATAEVACADDAALAVGLGAAVGITPAFVVAREGEGEPSGAVYPRPSGR
ncbi:hypothetical protein H8N01_26190 [Streptomyces sp. AC536]|uniref:hypothetical protein n=1 Tax=Streptomyces buecherae TaxID=2763006 RepID=UPI00164E1593|nr:hypothetical protein [Streptomyces buecherae]MBC3985973.1 hypothetical protein [Streptomyces buecherae]QNJ40517.1 hypothetical protein H7H31_12175 [Streptomyces buecherae]